MSVEQSFIKARDEVKKAFKTKKLEPSFAHAFIALIVAIFRRVRDVFFKVYNVIFNRLNKVLPLPIPKSMLEKNTLTHNTQKKIKKK